MSQPQGSTLYPWIRYWFPRGTTWQSDYLGFPTLQVYGYKSTSHLGQTLQELEHVPCIVLLGEPSIGKSSEVENYQPSKQSINVCKYRLNRRSEGRELYRSIENMPEFQAWLKSKGRFHLYLDGLDEAGLNIKTVQYTLVDWLDQNKRTFSIISDPLEGEYIEPDETESHASQALPTERSRFFLRLTCRSAHWSDETTKDLQRIFGAENVKVLELAPLTQSDSKIVAMHENINELQFVKAISDAGAANFAAEPMTLKLLLKSYQDGLLSGAQTDRASLYESGCLKYCEELNPDHESVATLSGSQRLSIASRLAAYSIIGNKAAIWKAVSSSGAPTDIQMDDVAGDDFLHEGKSDTLTISKVREVLDTGLFRLLENGRFEFKHKTFAEYLTARQLRDARLSEPMLKQFLTSAHDPDQAVPQLQEVVSWLCLLDAKAFEVFKESEPVLLIRSGKKFTPQQTQDLVKSMLHAAENFNLMDSYDMRKFYARLNHPGLNKQLKAYIVNVKRNLVSRRIAIDIAGECQVKELIPEIQKILDTETEHAYLRKQAAIALGKMMTPAVEQQLRKYALTSRADDRDDELKGVALDALYPEVLTTQEVFDALTEPKRNNLYAAYKGFLESVLALIPGNDFEAALALLANNDRFFESARRDSFERLLEGFVEMGWKANLSQTGVRNFAKLLLKLIGKYIDVTVPDDALNRREIAEALVALVEDSTTIYSVIGSHTKKLIGTDDWDWVIGKFRTTAGKEQIKYARILWLLFDRNDDKRAIEFLELIFVQEHVRNSLSHLINPIELGSEEAEKLKKQNKITAQDKKQKRKVAVPKLDFSPEAEAEKLLVDFSPTNLEAWWKLIFLMRINKSFGTFDTSHDFQLDITQLPLWKDLSHLHPRIILATRTYLDHYTPKSDWITSNQFDRRELAGYKAILLLQTVDGDFIDSLFRSPAFWNNWQATIIYASFNTLNELPEPRKLVLIKCWNATASQSEFISWIEQYLSHRLTSKSNDLYDLYKLKEIASDDLASMLFKIFNSKICPPASREYILNFIFKNNKKLSQGFAYKAFKKLNNKSLQEDERTRFVALTAKLLLHPDDNWDLFWRQLSQSTFAKEIFLAAAPGLDYAESRLIGVLTSHQKADVLLFLYMNFPPEEDPEHQTVYSPTVLDTLASYRSQIVRSLIEGGTPESVQALKSISDKLPGVTDFRWWHLTARELMRKNMWTPRTLRQLRVGFNDTGRRFVSSDYELIQVVEESLGRLQKKLSGNNPVARFLWDLEVSPTQEKKQNQNSIGRTKIIYPILLKCILNTT